MIFPARHSSLQPSSTLSTLQTEVVVATRTALMVSHYWPDERPSLLALGPLLRGVTLSLSHYGNVKAMSSAGSPRALIAMAMYCLPSIMYVIGTPL